MESVLQILLYPTNNKILGSERSFVCFVRGILQRHTYDKEISKNMPNQGPFEVDIQVEGDKTVKLCYYHFAFVGIYQTSEKKLMFSNRLIFQDKIVFF